MSLDVAWSFYDPLRLTLAFFNATILIWLGFTFVFHSDRLHAGVLIAGLSLFASGIFFFSYGIVFGRRDSAILDVPNLLWYLGLAILYTLPVLWYLLVLYYLRRRDRPTPIAYRIMFAVICLLFLVTGAPLVYLKDVPGILEVLQGEKLMQENPLSYLFMLSGFSIYTFFSVSASLIALLGNQPEPRDFHELARIQARPSLLIGGWTLFVMSALVSGLLGYFVWHRDLGANPNYIGDMRWMVRLDLPIALLIGVAIWFIGRAIVSYEIFTGVLPRRAIRRQWRIITVYAIIGGVGFAAAVDYDIDPLYGAPLWTFLSVLFFAMLGRRMVVDERRYLDRLRRFIGSQNLYHTVISSSRAHQADVARNTFEELCSDLLNARAAILIPTGSTIPLVTTTLLYPNDRSRHRLEEVSAQSIEERAARGSDAFVALDPTRESGMILAVPLRSHRAAAESEWAVETAEPEQFQEVPAENTRTKRNPEREAPVGLLLLSAKRDGGVYTQEEVHTARAAGERIIDAMAAAELSRILLILQRERLTENRLIDERTRRVLHDDVLPEIHSLMLLISSQYKDGKLERAGMHASETGDPQSLRRLSDLHGRISDLLRQAPIAVHPDIGRLGLIDAIRQAAESDPMTHFDELVWNEDPVVRRRLGRLPDGSADVLFYAAREAIRNASTHARVDGRSLRLEVRITWDKGLEIQIEDNGGALRSTAGTSASTGQGLTLHTAMMAVIGGSLEIKNVPDEFTRVRLYLPTHSIRASQ